MRLGFHGATSMPSDLQTDVTASAQAGFKALELWAVNVVIMNGNLAHEAAEQRTAGVKQVFENYPDINIIKEDTGKWCLD